RCALERVALLERLVVGTGDRRRDAGLLLESVRDRLLKLVVVERETRVAACEQGCREGDRRDRADERTAKAHFWLFASCFTISARRPPRTRASAAAMSGCGSRSSPR